MSSSARFPAPLTRASPQQFRQNLEVGLLLLRGAKARQRPAFSCLRIADKSWLGENMLSVAPAAASRMG